MCPVQERLFKPMVKGQPRFTPIVWRWQTMGRETSSNNERYGLQIFLLLFFGEYQTCLRVMIDKIP